MGLAALGFYFLNAKCADLTLELCAACFRGLRELPACVLRTLRLCLVTKSQVSLVFLHGNVRRRRYPRDPVPGARPRFDSLCPPFCSWRSRVRPRGVPASEYLGREKGGPAARLSRGTKMTTQCLMRNKTSAHLVHTRAHCTPMWQARCTEEGPAVSGRQGEAQGTHLTPPEHCPTRIWGVTGITPPQT